MLSTADICKKAGLTYDGMWIGLPEEYYKENYPKETLIDSIQKEIDREIAKDMKKPGKREEIAAIKALRRWRL